ncbi:MAG: helix-turn-helix transcriptional regulator [Elusimicrobia bacterium]|nr:helix-turn-helix transcriptional regulator [Elusimicrobiota bacterium]
MIIKEKASPFLLKKIRQQLSLSQEDLARELGVSFATVNRWENNQARPSKLAQVQVDAFYKKMLSQGKIKLPDIASTREKRGQST